MCHIGWLNPQVPPGHDAQTIHDDTVLLLRLVFKAFGPLQRQ